MLSASLFFGALPHAYATAGTPKAFSFQGVLANSSGVLLGGSTGTTYCFKFSIWDSATPSTGTRLWPSSSPSSAQLTVTNGKFAANVGIDTADALNFDFNSNATVYLQIEAATYTGSCGTFETFSPRKQVVAVPYALNADKIDGLDPGTSANNILKLDNDGGISLADSNPVISATGSNTLTFQYASTGNIQFFTSANRIASDGSLTLASTVNSAAATFTSASAPQLSARFDASNKLTVSVASDGVATLDGLGSNASIVVAKPFSVTGGPSAFTANANTTVPVTIKGAASQSANLLEVKDNGNAVVATITATGTATFVEQVKTPQVTTASGDLTITAAGTANILIRPNGPGIVQVGSSSDYLTIDNAGKLGAVGAATIASSMDTFMDVQAISTNAVLTSTACDGTTQVITGGITDPDVPRNVSITESGGSTPTGNVIISGKLSDGTTSTENISISDNTIHSGNKAFASITSITLPSTCVIGSSIAVGIGELLGLSNPLHGQSTVYKVKKNTAAMAIPTVDTTNSTVNMTTITSGDDITIWYRF